MATKQSITLSFAHDRDTKGARRFAEQVEEGSEPVVGTLYVRKSAGVTGDKLTVTIKAGE